MPCLSNHYRPNISNTLFPPYRFSFYFMCSYYTRCKLWMTSTKFTRKWGFLIFYLSISSHRPRYLLRILPTYSCMKYWNYNIYCYNSRCFSWLCSSMRTNKILGSNCYYKFNIRHSIYWSPISRMNVRRICS